MERKHKRDPALPKLKRAHGRYGAEDVATLLGISTNALRQRLHRAGILITHFPTVVLYIHEELKKGRKRMDDHIPFTHHDVLEAKKRLSQRGCMPTHIEISSKHLDEIQESLASIVDMFDKTPLDVWTSKTAARLYGMEIVKNEACACPAVQWRQRDEAPHQQELVVQGEE